MELISVFYFMSNQIVASRFAPPCTSQTQKQQAVRLGGRHNMPPPLLISKLGHVPQATPT